MRVLCVLQLLLGVLTISGGVAGVVLWTNLYSTYLPAVWNGLMFFISGWWGVRALAKKNKSNSDMTVAMTLTVTSIPVALALLSRSLCCTAAHLPWVKDVFNDTPFASRSFSLEMILTEAGLITCACLQIVVAASTVSQMRKVMRTREEESLVRSFYRSPSGPAPEMRLPVTHAWSYTPPRILETESDRFDRERNLLYASYGNPQVYPLGHHATTSGGRDSRK